ncbi:transposase [Leisingera sp.]|uniref:transposase n=1 Tax=Leisingera sp. TaxID=1879318 RepID=UPI002B279356|nr:transposase [Leisingera sp.]
MGISDEAPPECPQIVPGGGLSAAGTGWIACRRNFFLSVRVPSCLYHRLILEGLTGLHNGGKLQFFGGYAELVDRAACDAFQQRLRKIDWAVDAREPFAGPNAVLVDVFLRAADGTSRLQRSH